MQAGLRRHRVVVVGGARRDGEPGRRVFGAGPAIPEVGPHEVQPSVVSEVGIEGGRPEIVQAVAVRRQALPAVDATRHRVKRPGSEEERLRVEVIGDLDRRRPAGRERAVLRARTLDHHLLSRDRGGACVNVDVCVVVDEEDVEGPVGADDHPGPLVEVALVCLDPIVKEVGELAGAAGPADLHSAVRRPGRPPVGGLGVEDRTLEVIARLVHAEARPGDVDVVPLRALPVGVGKDELLVGKEQWGVGVHHHAEREGPERLRRARGGAVEESSPKRGIGLGDENPARRREVIKNDAGEIGVAARVHRQRRIARVIELMAVQRGELPERRDSNVTPVAAPVEGVGDAAVVDADAAVILRCDQVIGVIWVDHEKLLRADAEVAALIDPDVVVRAGEDLGTPDGLDRRIDRQG